MSFFDNVTWPSNCIFNVIGNVSSGVSGGADVEHHFRQEGEPKVWEQKEEAEREYYPEQ